MRNMMRNMFLALGIALLAAATTGTAEAALPAPATAPVAAVSPGGDAIVGIAAPVTVTFAAPVGNRARAERAIHVNAAAPAPVAGSFAWRNDHQVVWTPTGFLPANTHFTVSAGPAHTDFTTNSGTRAEGNISAHTFTVYVPGQSARTMSASMGKPAHPTPTGTFSVLEKDRTIIFDSRTIGIPLSSPEGYYLKGEYAERLTWSGVFVHSAPWSVGQQGHSNVSHGCINLSPSDAAWYYNNVSMGDPVTIN
ncbi:MAG: L,D-transpeptidase [Nocardia sp.]|nr:L,D-transpeptidase [Nocardia sp.]